MSSSAGTSSGRQAPSSRIAPPTTAAAASSTARRAAATSSGVPSGAARGTTTTGVPGMVPQRRPMAVATNRAGGASSTGPSSTAAGALRKPTSTTVAASTNARRAVSGTARVAHGVKRPSSEEEQTPAQINNIQAQLAAVVAMFDQERANTEAQMAAEKTERRKYEDKVLQLEENLEESKRLAKEHKREAGRRRTIFDDEMLQLRQAHAREKQMWEEDLERERGTIRALKDSMVQSSTSHLTLEANNAALRTELRSTQDQLRVRDVTIAEMETTLASQKAAVVEIENELREAESLRRKLHNEVQELRGNIRVFARIRPALPSQSGGALATIKLPNPREAREIEVLSAGESATGTATMKTFGFSFDRVFGPEASQKDVFGEVEHLMQSVLDGYNTCIFAYGQTGSGKTHTLEGSGLPDSNFNGSEADPAADTGAGLIPRAVQMLFATAESLKDKGWTYDFEGGMLEIYNENIHDLLGKGSLETALKHEVKHDKGRTSVSDAVVLPLTSPSQVFSLLSKAASKRSVAATLMNERSSRSHSVFTLRVRGSNASTMESCDATLSLVDLAGSERLANSGSGDDAKRFKEAVSINKSLSSLADVISALGAGKSTTHVPYRNSTLTWLLKNSLGGNSKTLMLLALSPMAEHLGESLCSLRFARSVNSTVIGTAKKVKAGE